ncbi:hypothetical protein J6590_033712 [Homalodisca vitripennis]|nr:hypothetical protein J6590_033712 [Homalodisca vitripennis]
MVRSIHQTLTEQDCNLPRERERLNQRGRGNAALKCLSQSSNANKRGPARPQPWSDVELDKAHRSRHKKRYSVGNMAAAVLDTGRIRYTYISHFQELSKCDFRHSLRGPGLPWNVRSVFIYCHELLVTSFLSKRGRWYFQFYVDSSGLYSYHRSTSVLETETCQYTGLQDARHVDIHTRLVVSLAIR